METLSIWSSDTAPFVGPFNGTDNPATPAAASIALTLNSGNPIWVRYMLPAPITGRYFLLHLQKQLLAGNPGGSEFRLAVATPGDVSATITSNQLPVISWPVYGDLVQASDLLGPWVPAVGVTNGVPVIPAGGNRFFRAVFQQ
jgi:hypothetical protein